MTHCRSEPTWRDSNGAGSVPWLGNVNRGRACSGWLALPAPPARLRSGFCSVCVARSLTLGVLFGPRRPLAYARGSVRPAPAARLRSGFCSVCVARSLTLGVRLSPAAPSVQPSRPALSSRLEKLSKVHPLRGSKLTTGRLVLSAGYLRWPVGAGKSKGGTCFQDASPDWSAKCPRWRTIRFALPLLSVVRETVVQEREKVRNQRSKPRLLYFTDFPWFPVRPVADVISAAGTGGT